MRNKNSFALFLLSTVALLVVSACRLGAPEATPEPTATVIATAAAPNPTKTAVPATARPLPPTRTPEPTQSSWEGEWSGKTSLDTDFQFTVQASQVVYFYVSVTGQKGSCSFSYGFGGEVSAAVEDGQFTIEWSDSDGNTGLVAGALTPAGAASGTADYTDNVKQVCDKTMHMEWNALSAAAIDAGTPVAPPERPEGEAGYNGEWVGENEDGNQVSFTIQNDQFTYIFFNYSVNTGSCSLSGGMGQSPDDGAITGPSFSVVFEDSDGRLFTFEGSFASDSEAAGNIYIKGVAGTFCDDFDSTDAWTAHKTSAGDDGDDEPTESPEAPVDVDAVVELFFNALRAGDIDGAMALANDPIFSFGSSFSGIGNDDLRSYLNTQIAAGITYTLSDVSAMGDSMVQFTVTVSDGTVYTDCLIMLDEGKIIMLKLE